MGLFGRNDATSQKQTIIDGYTHKWQGQIGYGGLAHDGEAAPTAQEVEDAILRLLSQAVSKWDDSTVMFVKGLHVSVGLLSEPLPEDIAEQPEETIATVVRNLLRVLGVESQDTRCSKADLDTLAGALCLRYADVLKRQVQNEQGGV